MRSIKEARAEAAKHGLSEAVADELHACGWVAHEHAKWADVASRAIQGDGLRASLSQLADVWEREARGGGDYAEIRRVHAAALQGLLQGKA